MSWVKAEINSMKADREWTLSKARILQGKRFHVWSSVCSQVRKDFIDLQAEYQRQVEFSEAPAHTLTVTKNSSPRVSVTASITDDCRGIKLLIQKLSSFGLSDEKDEMIGIDMDERENIRYLWFDRSLSSLEDVSRIILSPVLTAFRQ